VPCLSEMMDAPASAANAPFLLFGHSIVLASTPQMAAAATEGTESAATEQPSMSGSLSLPSSSRAPVISVHARQSDDFSVHRLSRDDGAAGPPLYRSRSAGKSDAAYFHLPAPSTSLRRSLSTVSRAASPTQSDASLSPAGRGSHSPAILPHASFFLPRRPARPAQQHHFSRMSESADGHTLMGGMSQISLSAVGGNNNYPDSSTSTSPPPSTFGRPSMSSYTKPEPHLVPLSSHLSEEGQRRSEESRSHHDGYESDYALATSDGGHSSSAHYEVHASTLSNATSHFSSSVAPQASVGALSLVKTDSNTTTGSRGPFKPTTAQPSREPLLDFPLTTLPEAQTTSNGSNKSVRRPSRISSDVVARVRNSFSAPSAIYSTSEKHKTAGLEKLSESVRRSSSTAAPPPSGREGYVYSQSGRRLRNYELHRGAHRFFLGGRLITSRDASWPFLCSLSLALILPAAFLVFNASWLWVWRGAAGKVVVVLFAYLTLIMWSNLVRAAWRDPGICQSFLESLSRFTFADPVVCSAEGSGRT
jgi:hypothetical protein